MYSISRQRGVSVILISALNLIFCEFSPLIIVYGELHVFDVYIEILVYINTGSTRYSRLDNWLYHVNVVYCIILYCNTMLPYYICDTWCGPSANLECRSEMCCSRLAANKRRKKVAKNRHPGTIARLCRAISSQLRHVSTIGKKN